VLPSTIGNYLAQQDPWGSEASKGEFKKAESQVKGRLKRLLAVKGKRSVGSFHRELGQLLSESCDTANEEANEEAIAERLAQLQNAQERLPALRDAFWTELSVPGSESSLNPSLQRAVSVADSLDLAELILRDALGRREMGRVGTKAADVAAWEHTAQGPRMHIETLQFENQNSERP